MTTWRKEITEAMKTNGTLLADGNWPKYWIGSELLLDVEFIPWMANGPTITLWTESHVYSSSSTNGQGQFLQVVALSGPPNWL